MLHHCLQTQTLLLHHLNEASGRQGVHEGMAPGILLQHVRDEPHGSGVHLLQPDRQNTRESQTRPLNPPDFALQQVENVILSTKADVFKGYISRSPSCFYPIT